MRNTRLIPYVEIPSLPRSQQNKKTNSPQKPSSTAIALSKSPKKSRTVLVPYVEIPPLHEKDSSRPNSPTPTELDHSPPRKRRKIVRDVGDQEDDDELDYTETIRPSPTVSDIEARLQSPTFSDIARASSKSKRRRTKRRARELSSDIDQLPVIDLSTVSGLYQPKTDELIETADLFIDGETPREELETSESDDDDDDVPVRLIQDFAVYDMKTKELVEFAWLAKADPEEGFYVASGIVRPWVEDVDHDVRNELPEEESTPESDSLGDRVQLSRILEINAHHFDDDKEAFDGSVLCLQVYKRADEPSSNRKIYLRTKFAWYILDNPSLQYRPHFAPYFVRQRLCHLVLSTALIDNTLLLDDFLFRLGTDPLFQDGAVHENLFLPSFVVGQRISREDMESKETRQYIASTIPQVILENGLQRLKRVPIIKYLLFDTTVGDLDYHGSSASSMISEEESYESDVSSVVEAPPLIPAKAKPGRPKQKRLPSNKERAILQHKNTTVVTPRVLRVVKDLYNLNLDVSGVPVFEEQEAAVRKQLKEAKEHHEDPKKMAWGRTLHSTKHYYESVTLDGEKYKIGDVVMVSVNPDDHDDEWGQTHNAEFIATRGANAFAENSWFCRIAYFYDHLTRIDPVTNGPVKMFHGHWFQHGSRTILQEVAHTKSLFLLDSCDNNTVATIFRKCTVKCLSLEENEDMDNFDPMGTDFHYALLWDEEQFAFVDIPTPAQQKELLESQPLHKQCLACAMRKQKEAQEEVCTAAHSGVTQFGVDYHPGDCVYVRRKNSYLLDIAQIEYFPEAGDGEVVVDIRYLGRRDEFKEEDDCAEERRLYLKPDIERIDFAKIDGKCYARHLVNQATIADWIKNDDHWYLNEKENEDGDLVHLKSKHFKVCDHCLSERESELREFKDNLKGNGRLRGLELFSGAGGLGTGMNLSGFVDTRWAAEFSPAAASSYRENHPNTEVYCQDVNLLLKHAIETREGKDPKPLISNFKSREKCPEMPRRGDVDFIFGGPPCQAFSGANHTPKANDIRSSLPCNMLSFVEEYEPDYFLLENVSGFLRFPLKATDSADGRRLDGGIKMGVVKMTTRTLIALGYQVRFKILEAGQYGCPQSRKRIIFWGAKRGLKLPDFPIPTHAFPRSCAWTVPCNPGRQVMPVTRSKDPNIIASGGHHYAPLSPVSIRDAIGDLPAFDWENPHVVFEETKAQRKDAMDRERKGICQFDAVRRVKKSLFLPGFPQGTYYATPPQNAYQSWMREKMGDNAKVMDHITKCHKAEIVEATVTMPFKANVTHTELPIPLQPRCARPGGKQADKAFYGRGDADSFFRTALTSSGPTTKGAWALHPWQKRVYTIREAARSQGFPDHYRFLSEKEFPEGIADDQQRQIGNAVPVPLALALGKALGEALKCTWKMKEREGSSAV
ncbi:hypothetical protein VNI00_012475 [Paramarasmius palmivorus]|uniref:Cytosine-specific methyltransferase n=1 Tax=Paramarasmius palmivorus TaxID=297713 RepID=A0AAW0C5Z9_9AGAR